MPIDFCWRWTVNLWLGPGHTANPLNGSNRIDARRLCRAEIVGDLTAGGVKGG